MIFRLLFYVLALALASFAATSAQSHPCGTGPIHVLVYQAEWCAPCKRVRALLHRYKKSHELKITEYLIEDEHRRVVDSERYEDLRRRIRIPGVLVYYPYIELCGTPLSIEYSGSAMEPELRKLLRIPLSD